MIASKSGGRCEVGLPTVRMVLLAALGVIILGARPVVAREEAGNPLPKIFADWNRRRQIAAVEYRVKGTRTWPRGSLNRVGASTPAADEAKPRSDCPERDVVGPIKRSVLLDLQRNRFRIDCDETNFTAQTCTPYRIHCLDTGNGQASFTRVFEDGLPGLGVSQRVDMQISRGDPAILPPSVFDGRDWPLFLGSGIVTHHGDRVRPTALTPPFVAAGLTARGTALVEGRECAIVRVENLEYLVDLERDSAIVRVTASPDRHFVLDIQYQKTPRGWLPRGWSRVISIDSKAILIERLEVEAVDLNPVTTEDQFTLRPEPGMKVDETTYRLDGPEALLKDEHNVFNFPSQHRPGPRDGR